MADTPKTRRRKEIEDAIAAQSVDLGDAVTSAAVSSLRGDAREIMVKLAAALRHLQARDFSEFMSIDSDRAATDVTDEFDEDEARHFLAALVTRADTGTYPDFTAEDRELLDTAGAGAVRVMKKLALAYRAREDDFNDRCGECAGRSVEHPTATPSVVGATGLPAPGISAGAPVGPPAPVTAVKKLGSLYEMAKLQNGGEPLPIPSRPASRLVILVLSSAEKEGGLPSLKDMCPSLSDGSDKDPSRWLMLDEFTEAVRALAIAFCGPVGKDHLASIVAHERDKCHAAKATDGSVASVGAKLQDVVAVAQHVRHLCCPTGSHDSGASPYQTRRACEAAWSALCEGTEGLTVSITRAADAARASVTYLVADKKKAASAAPYRKATKRPADDDSSSSSSSEPPSPRKKRKDRKSDKKKDKKKSKSSRKYESSSSSDSGQDSESDASDDDGRYVARDKWGGALNSHLACHREAFKKGGCARKRCHWSHDPEILAAHRKKEGKKKKKDKSKKKK